MDPLDPEAHVHFLHVAESLHFARSAAALHMSPSALTRSIQRLEAALGHRLFSRTRRSVRLTRAGEIFREYALGQVSAQAQLFEALQSEEASPTGELRIACTVTACHSILPKLLARCRSRYPGIRLQLGTSDAVRASERLAADEVDAAIVPAPSAKARGLVFAELAHTELSFIAPARDKALQRRAEAGGEHWGSVPMILPHRGLERERIDAFFTARRLSPAVYAEVDGNEAILAMVALGCGVGVVPELVRKDSPLRGNIKRLDIPDAPKGYAVALCVKEDKLERRTLRAFWDLAIASG